MVLVLVGLQGVGDLAPRFVGKETTLWPRETTPATVTPTTARSVLEQRFRDAVARTAFPTAARSLAEQRSRANVEAQRFRDAVAQLEKSQGRTLDLVYPEDAASSRG